MPGDRRFFAFGSSTMSLAASPQKRMDRTMFLPTPITTGASLRLKTPGSSAAARYALRNQPYRGWKVSWRANTGAAASASLTMDALLGSYP